MRDFSGRIGACLKQIFEYTWRYTGSLAAVCLFAAALGLGIFHAVVHDAGVGSCRSYAGVLNTAGAEPPRGLFPLGNGNVSGVPHVRMEYSQDGKLTRMRHLDADGNLATLPASRVAEQQVRYDKFSRLRSKINKDAMGNPAEDAQGIAVREYDYDAAGRLVRTRFRNAKGELTSPRFPGYAECRLSYDKDGRLVRQEYLDAAGHPAVNANGEQNIVYTYGDNGTATRENHVNGQLTDNLDGVAREMREMTPTGTRCSWQSADGLPAAHPDSGAEAVQQDEHLAYGLARSSYTNAAGVPCATQRACAEHLQRRNRQGQVEWECFNGADGLPVNHPAHGYAERVCEYAPDGTPVREYFWNEDGNPAALHERRFAGNFALTLHSDGSTAVQPVK